MYSMAGISEKRSYRGIGRAREAVDKGGRMRGARRRSVNPTGRANDLNKQLEGVTCKQRGEKAGWKFPVSSGRTWLTLWFIRSLLFETKLADICCACVTTAAHPKIYLITPEKNKDGWRDKRVFFVFSSSLFPSDKRVHMHIKRSVWNLYWAHQKKYPNGNKSFIIFKEILFQFPLDAISQRLKNKNLQLTVHTGFRIFCSSLGWTRGITTDL